MIGEDFMYGTSWLSEYGMVMCTPDEAQQFVSRTFDRAEITPLRPNPNHYSTAYSDTLVLNFFIMKGDGCDSQEDYKLNGDEVHYLRAWLESPKKPTELVIPMEEDEMTTHYFGLFTDVQPFLNEGDCYGLLLTFTCNAPYGYSDELKTRISEFYSGVYPVQGRYVNMSAELEEYLKPMVTVVSNSTFSATDTLVIKNESDGNKQMSITLPLGKDKIVIDCQNKIITDGDGNLVPMGDVGVTIPVSGEYNFISTNSFVFYWLSLVPGDNKLLLTASENTTIDYVEISARYAIKSGGF